jgi:hypothetical protein
MGPLKSLVAVLGFGVVASASVNVLNFDRERVGHAPPGWTVGPAEGSGAPRWEVRSDRTAPTQPYVLAQTSADDAGGSSPIAILNGVSIRDGDVSVRLKPMTGRKSRSGGVVFRYRDPNNYYVASADSLRQDVVVYKVENGVRRPLVTPVKREIPANEWSILKVSLGGSRIQVFMGHRRILRFDDTTFRGPGKVGLWTGADSVTYFDDFRVSPK